MAIRELQETEHIFEESLEDAAANAESDDAAFEAERQLRAARAREDAAIRAAALEASRRETGTFVASIPTPSPVQVTPAVISSIGTSKLSLESLKPVAVIAAATVGVGLFGFAVYTLVKRG